MLEGRRQPLDSRVPAGAHVECHPIPADDAEFVAFVAACHSAADGMEPHELVGRLRVRYPDAVVHVQTALARVDGTWVWYVYRDG